ncbi:MAG: sulfide/dihydroorotate dehydrogenase-like FAD/NAD-binding protein [Promethearchaeota archaeon]
MSKKLSFKIDNKIVEFSEGQTILQVAKKAGIYIPTLCYIEDLKPYGGCRLCTVKVVGEGKPLVTACSTPATQNMEVITKDDELQDLRKDILKLLLSEHPSSCLVCDHKDQCENLKYTKNKFGRMFGCSSCSKKLTCEIREIADYLQIDDIPYELEYRNLPLKRNEPFLEIDPNMCVLCGKCVRICNELRGIGAISLINRGYDTQVSTAFDKLLIDSNCQFCGACVDICPTSALSVINSKWVINVDDIVTSTCGFCSVGCGFDYYSVSDKIVKSIPNKDCEINKGQSCVIGRFCTVPFINGKDRLKYPLIRRNGELINCNWDEAYNSIIENLKKYRPDEIAILASPDLSNESAYVLHKLARKIVKTNNLFTKIDGNSVDIINDLSKQLFNKDFYPASFSTIENSDLILLINADIQKTHPILLINLKKAKENNAKIISINIGEYNLPFETESLVDIKINLSIEGINVKFSRDWTEHLHNDSNLNLKISSKDLNLLILLLNKYFLKHGKYKSDLIENFKEFNFWIQNHEILDEENKFEEFFNRILNNCSNNKITIILGHLNKISKNYLRDLIGTIFNLRILLNNNLDVIPLWNRSNIAGVFQNIFNNSIDSQDKIFNAIREGKIKLLYTTERIENIELMKSIEFLIIQDIYPSEMMQIANVVLPTCTFIESSGSFINSEQKLLTFEKSTSNIGQSQPDWKIFSDLAKKFVNDLNIKDFEYSNSNEILNELKLNNFHFKEPSTIKMDNSSNKLNLYIPRLELVPLINEKPFKLNEFIYRGEMISEQVPDLRKLIKYRNIKESKKAVKVKQEKLQKTNYKVKSIEEVALNIYKIVISIPFIPAKAKPGNFIILMKDEKSERIPLTLSDWNVDEGTITVYVQDRGFSTQELTRLKKGDYIYSIVGPLGNPIEIKKYGTVLLAAGCYGIGAIYPIAKALKAAGNKIIIVLEARNKNFFYLEKEFEEIANRIEYFTSDGSKGEKGKINLIIKKLLNKIFIDQCYFIGCNQMMKEASDITKTSIKIPTFVSLNTIMIDGTGLCGGCRFTLTQEGKKITKFACVDGPIFDGHLVDWDLLIERGINYSDSEIDAYRSHRCKALEKYEFNEIND